MLIFALVILNNMVDYKFYMMRYGEQEASWKDLETEFAGLRYKECTGLNSYGEPTNMYAEDFAETSKAEVYVSSIPAHKQTTIKLTLIFLEDDTKDDKSYCDFMAFIAGSKIAYRDTARKRKVLMYLSGATEPKSDTLYGQKYKEVTFTFTNVYGRSFGYDESFPNE